MALSDTEQKKLEENIQKIKEIGADSLERKGQDFEFSEIFQIIKIQKNFFENVLEVGEFWESLLREKQSSIVSKSDKFLECIERIANFNVQKDNEYQSIKSEITSIHRDLTSDGLLTQFIAFSAKDANQDFRKLESQFSDRVREIQTTLAKSAPKSFIKDFNSRAENHENSSKRWLWGLMIIGILAIGFAIFIFVYSFFEDSKSENINDVLSQFFTSRALIIPVLLTIFTVCSRYYRANIEFQIQNENKASVGQSIETLLLSADSEESRNSIIEKAADTLLGTEPQESKSKREN